MHVQTLSGNSRHITLATSKRSRVRMILHSIQRRRIIHMRVTGVIDAAIVPHVSGACPVVCIYGYKSACAFPISFQIQVLSSRGQ